VVGQASSQDDNLVVFNNTPVSFNSTASVSLLGGRFRWESTTSAISGTAPTILFAPSGSQSDLLINGVDLSFLGSGKSLLNPGVALPSRFIFRNCKLGASVAITSSAGSAGQGGTEVSVINCDSADTNYRFYAQSYQGSQQHEATIVRTGGASDGTTTISRKLITTSASSFISPLASEPILKWNETVGSPITVSIAILSDGWTNSSSNLWFEVSYLGTSGFPLGNVASSRAANVQTAGTNLLLDATSTWTTTGTTDPIKQTIGVTFTPMEKGIISGRVFVARPSSTNWFDPKFQ